jgi:hypothetical protein
MPLIAAAFFAVPPAAAAPGPLVLGTRDGLEVVLFPEPRPHVLQVLPAVVVVLRPGAPVPAELMAGGESPRPRHLGASPRRTPWRPLATRWAAHPDVLAADPDALRPHRGADFDDPHHGGQWYLEKLKMDPLFAVSLGSPDVRVAVIDSSTEIAHPDLAPAVDAPFDAVDDDADPSPIPGEFCPRGVLDLCDTHGTGVSGIIAARANNGIGIVGLCPQCTLIPIRLISDGNTPLSADVRAFEHAIEQDAAVINNSWGFTEATPCTARRSPPSSAAPPPRPRGGLGAVVVFAAGNDDRDLLDDDEITGLPETSCASPRRTATAARRPTRTGRPRAWTSAAPSATVTLAPGGGVHADLRRHLRRGAPVVSGLAAWALSVAPELSAADLRALLVETAAQSPLITPDADGHHPVYGYGLVRPDRPARPARAARAPDAGVPDAGPPPVDAVVEPGDAAPQPADMGGSAGDDATATTDPDATPPESDGGGGGGGCQAGVGRSGAGTGFAALALMLLAGARRARRATATTSPNRTTDSGR